MSIGEQIKKYRKMCGMTQAELAEKIGRTESSVRKYENGDVEAPLLVIESIAEKLGTTVIELLGYSPQIIIYERIPLSGVPTTELLREIERRVKHGYRKED